MNKQSFVFYETFYEQLQDLDAETQLKFYNCIITYGLYGTQPEGLNSLEKALWKTFKFAIDGAKERRAKNIENGKKGGRPPKVKKFEVEYKVTEVKPEKDDVKKPITTKNNRKKPNANLNVNVNVNGNGNGNVNDDVTLQDIFTNHEIHNEILTNNDILNLNEIQQNNDIYSKPYFDNDYINSYDIHEDISNNLEFKTKFEESNDHYIYISEEKNEKREKQKNIQTKFQNKKNNYLQTKNFDSPKIKSNNHFVNNKNIFSKPNIKEIQDYCRFRKNDIDANVFFDFYESVGWVVGNRAMCDWKATVRVWEHRNKQKTKTFKSSEKKGEEVHEMDYSDEAFEKFFGMPLEEHNALVEARCGGHKELTDEEGAEFLGISVEEFRAWHYGFEMQKAQ